MNMFDAVREIRKKAAEHPTNLDVNLLADTLTDAIHNNRPDYILCLDPIDTTPAEGILICTAQKWARDEIINQLNTRMKSDRRFLNSVTNLIWEGAVA